MPRATLLTNLQDRVEAAPNRDLLVALRVLTDELCVRLGNYVDASEESEGATDDGLVLVAKAEQILDEARYGYDRKIGRSIRDAERWLKKDAVEEARLNG